MNEQELIKYYNKFNEDKRLNTKHAKVEYLTAMKYIHDYLNKDSKILDVGAGCGRYSVELANEGYDVTAIELVKHNLRVIEKKSDKVKAYLGNALDLSRFDDDSFDVTLLFGPLYHLISEEEKIKALNEALRVTKGVVLISYCMNEYAIITHGFIDNHIMESLDSIDDNFHCISKENDLYSYVRLEDINRLNEKVNAVRVKIASQDGPAEYLKKTINNMDDDTFDMFFKYHLKNCERTELLGAGRHILDIIKKRN